MDKKVLKKRMRSWFALVLALAMMFGSSLTVFAENIYIREVFDSRSLVVDKTVLCGGDVILLQESGFYVRILINGVVGVEYSDELALGTGNGFTLPGTSDTKYLLEQYYEKSGEDNSHYYTVALKTISKPEPTSEPEKEQTDNHEHSYSWVTVQEATAEQDGIEEYRCSCGDVKERNVIPASQALVSGLFDIVKNIPLNGVAQYDSGRLYTMSDYIIKKLAERSDVTTVVTFEYERKPYKMTIPAGVDYSAILADDDYFYGYFYFAKITGSTIEEVN
ncbi:MAG: hypothetical protein Q4C57_10675 [Bacillota bacterium]|nr:hypothetical protein [Bacillota bacterium]MDO4464999.1 hypothetical protein [Bacillota bacterium]